MAMKDRDYLSFAYPHKHTEVSVLYEPGTFFILSEVLTQMNVHRRMTGCFFLFKGRNLL